MKKTSAVINAILCCFFALPGIVLKAQSSFNLPATLKNKEVWFDSHIGVFNSGIVNGPEYKLLARGTKTHPFFLTGETSGKIKIEEHTYTGTIKFDIYTQTLVLKYINTSDNSIRFVELERAKIAEFEIFEHRFKNFEGKGFYDLLLETDNLCLVVNRTKRIVINDRKPDFQSEDFFYLLEGGKWKPIRNGTSIVKLANTKDKSRALRKFIRGKKLKSKGFFDETKLVEVITYYDALKNISL